MGEDHRGFLIEIVFVHEDGIGHFGTGRNDGDLLAGDVMKVEEIVIADVPHRGAEKLHSASSAGDKGDRKASFPKRFDREFKRLNATENPIRRMENTVLRGKILKGEDTIRIIESHIDGLPNVSELMGRYFRLEIGGMVGLKLGFAGGNGLFAGGRGF